VWLKSVELVRSRQFGHSYVKNFGVSGSFS
jgi:hypothetical protein